MQTSEPQMPMPTYRTAAHEIRAVVALFVVPYAAAVVLQDALVPAYRAGNVWSAVGLGVLLLVGLGAALVTFARSASSEEAGSSDHSGASPDAVILSEPVCVDPDDVRKLGTIVRSLRQDAAGEFPRERTLQHLTELSLHVERIGNTLGATLPSPRPDR